MSDVAAFIEVQSGRDARVSDFFEIRCNHDRLGGFAVARWIKVPQSIFREQRLVLYLFHR